LSEKSFTDKNGAVLRAGVVYGEDVGGIFQILVRYANASSILPLPFSGQSRLFTTHIDDLCDEVVMMLEHQPTGVLMAANSWPISLRELLNAVVEVAARPKKVFFLSVNHKITRTGLFVLKALRFRITFIDSLRSLESEASMTELSSLVPTLTPFRSFRKQNQNDTWDFHVRP
jgi:nucleoside-diphosphate-sugar epimerase